MTHKSRTLSILALVLGALVLSAHADAQGEDVVVVSANHGDQLFATEASSLHAQNTQPHAQPASLEELQRIKAAHAQNAEEFIPTNEWQPIKPGQAIPAGLHVRLDLSTGQRMAKLIEKEEPSASAEQPGHVLPPALAFSREMVSNPKGFMDAHATVWLRGRYPDVIHKLETTLMGLNGSCDAATSALHQLADDFDDVDQSKDLCNAGFFQVLYLAAHPENKCGMETQNAALVALGAALQNNPHTQTRAISDGVVSLLFNLLSQVSHSNMTNENTAAHAAKIVYALGALVRNQEDAQQVITSTTQWNPLFDLMDSLWLSRAQSTGAATALRKVFALMFDLGLERGVKDLRWLGDANRCPDQCCYCHLCHVLAHVITTSQKTDLVEQAIDTAVVWASPCHRAFTPQVALALQSRFPSLADQSHKCQTTSQTVGEEANDFDDPVRTATLLRDRIMCGAEQ